MLNAFAFLTRNAAGFGGLNGILEEDDDDGCDLLIAWGASPIPPIELWLPDQPEENDCVGEFWMCWEGVEKWVLLRKGEKEDSREEGLPTSTSFWWRWNFDCIGDLSALWGILDSVVIPAQQGLLCSALRIKTFVYWWKGRTGVELMTSNK